MIDKANKTATHAMIQTLFSRYPEEAAKLLSELSSEDILQYLHTASEPATQDIINHLPTDIISNLLPEMEDVFFSRFFKNTDPVRAAVLFSRLKEGDAERCLALLPERLARETKELMAYPDDTAGKLMDPQVAFFFKESTVESSLAKIRTLHNRRIIDLCVVDDTEHFIGTVPLQEVAVSMPETRLEELLIKPPLSVTLMAPRDEIVEILETHKLASLPVVDMDGKLMGIIRYNALLIAAQENTASDMQRMFGAGKDERALSSPLFAIKKRLPWLEVNLATAFLAAAVVSMFEDTIAKITALAVFLPVVAGQSGNTGSQSLAVVMRGLALREIQTRHWLRVAKKEILVGAVNGLTVAITTSLIAYLWMGSYGLSIVIGIAMVLSMVIAAFSGAVIPVMLKSFGFDPAQSSSIVLTTVTDIAGFMSFLGLAKILSGTLNIS